jgi:hypothetical protein
MVFARAIFCAMIVVCCQGSAVPRVARYIASHPRSQILADAGAEATMILQRAPQINAGEPIAIANVHNSRSELDTAQTLHSTGAPLAQEEISVLEIRHQAVLIEHVIATTPALAPGPGGLANVNMDEFREMQRNMVDIQGRLVQLENVPRILGEITAAQANMAAELANMAAELANMAAVQARLLNESIRRRNKRALHINDDANDAAIRLFPLNKEVRGLGPGLPGMAPIVGVPAIEVGTPVGRPFPTTLRELLSLSAPAINRLSIMFNDDFGIMRRDDLAQMRAKFLRFITAY